MQSEDKQHVKMCVLAKFMVQCVWKSNVWVNFYNQKNNLMIFNPLYFF